MKFSEHNIIFSSWWNDYAPNSVGYMHITHPYPQVTHKIWFANIFYVQLLQKIDKIFKTYTTH